MPLVSSADVTSTQIPQELQPVGRYQRRVRPADEDVVHRRDCAADK